MRLFIFLAVLFCFVDSFAKDVLVKGHYRRDGTYVQPYYRTSPDSTKLNNFSTKGNVNPYTGKEGTVNPYESDDSGSSYYDSNED